MIFTDLIFVFAFLPVYIAASFCCREAWAKNLVSVVASVVFISWGRPGHLWYYALIILPVFLTYISGLLSKRFNPIAAEAVSDVAAVGYSAFAVISAGTENTLRSALISVGFILFALRSILYSKRVAEGMKPEKDLFALAAYLISFENMLIAPLADYDSVRKRLSERRPTLSKMSAGLTSFIIGFAKASVIGLTFERVRLAAVAESNFPWMNAIFLAVVTFGEVYVMISSFAEMSCGLGLISGLSPRTQTPAFLPKYRITDHISEMWESLPEFVIDCFCKRTSAGLIISLAAISLLSGVFLSFGAASAAFLGIIFISIILESISQRKSKTADALFSAVMLIAAFSVLIAVPTGGYAHFFSAFTTSCGFDITYSLFTELLWGLPWMILGIIVVSPLYRYAAALLRIKMSEDEKFYAAARVTQTVACVVLLVIATASAAA